ncbi:hypothetical protein QYM36_015606 [Artemia franciscana]|uniref:ESF1 RRM domain-containing protein n=1 Tax=Artemia franciscana TaxID=6661 RepID=A0AA88HAP3_ARTSF|nr:hypothetical protein QYM36_015606 [Artemia franciscana]
MGTITKTLYCRDSKFNIKYQVDKRGRPINLTSEDHLNRYYGTSSSDESSDAEEEDGQKTKENNFKEDKNNKKQSATEGKNQLSNEEDVSHPWGELDAEADKTDESTKRLAICNMDWDRIHVVDLMVLLNSFISGNGSIKSVTVYEECDGIEYESSATKLDLRFIPDMEFEHDPNDECTSLPDPTRYEPKFFVNSPLQQAKVELTWEENDPLRKANMEFFEGEESDVENTDDANEDNVAKYRAFLAEIDKPKEEKEMEITWGVGLKEKVEQLVEKKLSGKDKLTPWEQYLEKKKEKRKQNREKTKLEETEGTSPTESEDDTPSDIDMNDPYFKEEFVNNPEFEKLKKKSKKKLSAKKNSDPEEGLKQQKAELELLLGDDDRRKHFSLKNILKKEEIGKKKKKKKNQEDFEEAMKEGDFKLDNLFEIAHANSMNIMKIQEDKQFYWLKEKNLEREQWLVGMKISRKGETSCKKAIKDISKATVTI